MSSSWAHRSARISSRVMPSCSCTEVSGEGWGWFRKAGISDCRDSVVLGVYLDDGCCEPFWSILVFALIWGRSLSLSRVAVSSVAGLSVSWAWG